MKSRRTTLRVFPVVAVVVLLAACDTQVSLETAPQAIRDAAQCPNEIPPSQGDSGPWGSAQGNPPRTLEYDVNAGYTVTFCLRGGQEYGTLKVEGPDSGSVEGPGPGNNNLSGWSVTDVSGEEAVDPEEPGGEETEEPGGEETEEPGGEETEEPGGEETEEPGGEETEEPGGEETEEPAEEETEEPTEPPSAAGPSVTEGEGPPVTEDGVVDPTTTVEVGAGGVTTTPGGEGEGTLDPSQEASTTADEVAGASDETLPRTGTGQMSLSGLAGLLLGAGAILLLLVRSRSRED